MRVLDRIDDPRDLTGLSHDELTQLADEGRGAIIETITKRGGHLARTHRRFVTTHLARTVPAPLWRHNADGRLGRSFGMLVRDSVQKERRDQHCLRVTVSPMDIGEVAVTKWRMLGHR